MPINQFKTAPFGTWRSPISPLAASYRMRIQDIQWDTDDRTFIWLEGRSGRNVLVVKSDSGCRRDLTDEHSVETKIGYGGGEFTTSQGLVFFVASDGRIYRRTLGYGQPQPITPSFGKAAAPTLSPDGAWIVYVFSDGKSDLLAVVDSQGKEWPQQLARGADFYMQPTFHPSGETLAWIEWDHPCMPWDGTRLKLAEFSGKPPRLSEVKILAGDSDTPVCQPLFSPDGRWLSYITSNGEWEDLVLYNLESQEKRILIKGDGFHLTIPAWVQGIRSYGWDTSGKRIFSIHNYAGQASLWITDISSGTSTQIDISPYTWVSQLAISPVDNQLIFIASSPQIPERIVRWDGKRLHVEAHCESENIPPEFHASPKQISWKNSRGEIVHGIYYPPCNPEYQSAGLPPALLHIHGGPTGSTSMSYSVERTYFTSRGFAWLDVNYHGSTGYGRSYMTALRRHWGEVDTDDCASAAKALIDQKLADPQRLIISGGSAGGFTVLNCLIHHPGLFKAGINRYGVSSLFTLSMDTHKFEERYNDSIVGPLPEASSYYHAWSPIFHVKEIRDPLAVFQGAEDRVVVPSQSESIVAELVKNDIPHIYRLYEGEGHGFRKNETLLDYYSNIDRFLKEFVLFAP